METSKEKRLFEYHQKQLRNGTYLVKDGQVTTIDLRGVTGPDGKIYNVPSFFNGKIQSEEAAITRAAKIGWKKYPAYATGKEANTAARRLHTLIEQDTEKFFSNKKTILQ